MEKHHAIRIFGRGLVHLQAAYSPVRPAESLSAIKGGSCNVEPLPPADPSSKLERDVCADLAYFT